MKAGRTVAMVSADGGNRIAANTAHPRLTPMLQVAMFLPQLVYHWEFASDPSAVAARSSLAAIIVGVSQPASQRSHTAGSAEAGLN